MVTEFTVFGSCSCRDLFNSTLNKNYKDFFRIGKTGIRLSFISMMQKPVSYDAESLDIFPKEEINIHFSEWIKMDLDKVFLEDLKNENFEYMMLDTYYDTNFGVVDIGDNRYITNNIRLNQTEFFKNLEYKRFLTIQNNTAEYFELWKKSCDSFFEYLETYCPDLKVILNPSRHVYKVLNEDGSVSESEEFKLECKKYNKYRDLLDEYILKNFDVDVLEFDDNTLVYNNHLWGVSSLHYEESYYLDMTKQLNEIIERNNLLKTNNLEDLNKKFRYEKRKHLLYKIKHYQKASENPSNITYTEEESGNSRFSLNCDTGNNIIKIQDHEKKFPEHNFTSESDARFVCDYLNANEKQMKNLKSSYKSLLIENKKLKNEIFNQQKNE